MPQVQNLEEGNQFNTLQEESAENNIVDSPDDRTKIATKEIGKFIFKLVHGYLFTQGINHLIKPNENILAKNILFLCLPYFIENVVYKLFARVCGDEKKSSEGIEEVAIDTSAVLTNALAVIGDFVYSAYTHTNIKTSSSENIALIGFFSASFLSYGYKKGMDMISEGTNHGSLPRPA